MDDPSLPGWLQALLPLLPAVLAPAVGWFLSQRGVARRIKEFEHLLKRMELVERLRSLQEYKGQTKSQFRETLDAEVSNIVAGLAELREAEHPIHITAVEVKPRWRRFLLLYKQASLKGAIYKGLFYTFLLFSVMTAVSFATLTSLEVVVASRIFYSIFAGVFYLIPSLLFRAAAVRDYRRRLKKGVLIDKKSGV